MLQLWADGRHHRAYEMFGAHRRLIEGWEGFSFAVWAPRARRVALVLDGEERHPMRRADRGGVWEVSLPGDFRGRTYAYEVTAPGGRTVAKTDPFAFATEPPPGWRSVVSPSDYCFSDQAWMARRPSWDPEAAPLSIYEVHLGSWRRRDGGSLSYRELAETLPAYAADMGFTHIEFLPVTEHPFRGSWGYQTTHYFAPTARLGDPDDLKLLIDSLHQTGIGVIVDWVPAHFPRDEWALARFDGSPLYEDADPQKGQHPDWGTLVFDYSKPEVRSFLVSSALFWAERFHVDGLRVDAVASMLYLDYSRAPGEWSPNRLGGRENLEAVEFITQVTSALHEAHPDVLLIAEESGAWPGVTKPVQEGGLGFDFKWNLGWMHDTLQYFRRPTVSQRNHVQELTFTLMYAWNERFILPLSHDEVVHEKGSLATKMLGDERERLATLRCLLAYMWAYPGKKLLFMGGEIGQEREWNHDRELDWELLDDEDHAGVQRLVRDLNSLYLQMAELWQQDLAPGSFRWTADPDARNNVITFVRSNAAADEHLVCVCNLAPVVRTGFRIGVPAAGSFREVLNTGRSRYGGTAPDNPGVLETAVHPAQGMTHSVQVTLAPRTTVWLHT